jgi:mannan endo-1,4-beta-mannosidase
MPQPRSPQAQHLYEFLCSVKGRYVLSGQHNYVGVGAKYTELVERLTGKRPLIWGSDFAFAVEGTEVGRHYHCGPLNISDPGEPDPHFIDVSPEEAREKMIACALEQHQRGHIITLMWHCCFPTYGDRGPYDSLWQVGRLPSEETWQELTTPGTDLHSAWTTQVDRIVPYLARLRDAGVPVIWRPYHELNGVWFWWCNKPGPEGFAKLWRMMHDRYTNHHQLNNLLWVYNTNAPRDRENDEAYAYDLFYPGGEQVDVLAADVYRNDYRQSHHDEMVALADGRPVALGEVGEVPTPEVLRSQPDWCWFMPWGALVSWNENKHKVPALYASERVLALGDIVREPDGMYRLAATAVRRA